MAKYYMTSGLFQTQIQEFENDIEAWNTLRLSLPHKFVTLKKRTEIQCEIVNPKQYIPKWNSAYAKRPIGYGPDNVEPIDVDATHIPHYEYIGVFEGFADDEIKY